MKKEELLELGLSEEQAEAVVGKYVNMIPKARLDEINKTKKALEEQLGNYETQLEELKNNANGNEELKKQLEEMQTANSTLKSEYESKLQTERLNAALKMKLNGKVHDTDLVLSQINKESIKLDENGNVTEGLDEQINTLKESKSFLFIPEQTEEVKSPTIVQSWKPSQPPQGEPAKVSIGAQIAARVNGYK